MCWWGVLVTANVVKYSTPFRCLFWASVYFSVTLLVFVSIERLIAVKRPHAFSMDSRRAKWALFIIAVTSALCTIVPKLAVHSAKANRRKLDLIEIAFIGSGIIVMIICYTLIAVGLLKKSCYARNQIAN